MMTENEKAFMYDLEKQDRLSEVCRHQFYCHGLSLVPYGPCYPACADGDYECFVDLDALEELMQEKKDND